MNYLKSVYYRSYYYFDQYSQLQKKELNAFQRIARQVFGFYEETHSRNVVKRVYQVTFNSNPQMKDEKTQDLLKLIQKVNRLYQNGDGSSQDQFYVKIEDCTSTVDGHVSQASIEACYGVVQENLQDENSRRSISKIHFRIRNAHPMVEDKELYLSLGRRLDHLVVWFNDIYHQSYDFPQKNMKIMSSLLVKILQDSEDSSVECYMRAYSMPPYLGSSGLLDYRIRCQRVTEAHSTRAASMQAGGWDCGELVGRFQERRTFVLAGAAPVPASLVFLQTISIDFAAGLLENCTAPL